MTKCTLCPRNCRTDREKHLGYCGVPREILISKIMLHRFEEPCISGLSGSGAVFFCGCPLGCVFCQNGAISRRGESGKFTAQRAFTESELVDELLKLQSLGAHNINFVSPTQYTDALVRVVADAKARGLTLPIVWNTGGYEKSETIQMLEGTVDVFLTDMKYHSSEISSKLSSAKDYFDYAMASLKTMCQLTGSPTYNNGIMTRGVIVRHLVLPSCRKDSAEILSKLKAEGLEKVIVLSLMSQYTPDFFIGCADEKLNRSLTRRITTFEYEYVRSLAASLGFTGFGQERTSSQKEFTPTWGF